MIIAGTIGKSDVINTLVSSHKLDISSVKGHWESFISQVIEQPLPGVDKALVIAGSDLRGTIYGLYDVSEQIGVSPWWWFADVPVRRAKGIWALLGVKKVQKEPSVKYRGIFINDEQPALTNWIKYAQISAGLINDRYIFSKKLMIVALITSPGPTALDSTITSTLTSLSCYFVCVQIICGLLSGQACTM